MKRQKKIVDLRRNHPNGEKTDIHPYRSDLSAHKTKKQLARLYKSEQDEEGVLCELLARKLNTSSSERLKKKDNTHSDDCRRSRHSLPAPTTTRHG